MAATALQAHQGQGAPQETEVPTQSKDYWIVEVVVRTVVREVRVRKVPQEVEAATEGMAASWFLRLVHRLTIG